MALIKCPECKKEISDKVKTCPHCGFPLIEETIKDITAVSLKTKNSLKTKRILVSLFIIVLMGISVFLFLSFQKVQKLKIEKNEYIDNLEALSYSTLIAASEAESLCNLTGQVWQNTIYEKSDPLTDKYTKYKIDSFYYFNSDFNDSLALLFKDSTTQDIIAYIKLNQSDTADLMKKLTSPPEGFEKIYDTACEMYSDYLGLTDLVIDPSGSLKTFLQNKSNKIDEYIEKYKKLKAMIPEKQEIKFKKINKISSGLK